MADPKASVANPYAAFAAIRQSLVVHACCHHKQMILANPRHPREAVVRVGVRVGVRVMGEVRPTVGAQMEESVGFVGCARGDVHRDPTKPAVHKNTKHADRDAAPTCEYSRQNQVVRSGPPAVWSPWALSP